MGNEDQIEILRQGAVAWNKWMTENPDEHIDLSEADPRGANLYKANLSEADLRGANLREASLNWANLYKANLFKANLSWANLSKANLSWADLSGADLSRAYLYKANLCEANLSRAIMIETNMESAILTSCIVYRICAWELDLGGAMQNDLVITPPDQPAITVDNLDVAQFIYLLLHNEKIHEVIDTITSKVVLILGRFTPERKAVLDALRTGLRQRGYLPILFDFEKSTIKDFTENIKILADMSFFVIADISNPKSSPLELQATIPDYIVPFVLIIQEGEEPFATFEDLLIRHKKWVLAPLKYDSIDGLIGVLDKAIINPALELHNDIIAERPLRCHKANWSLACSAEHGANHTTTGT